MTRRRGIFRARAPLFLRFAVILSLVGGYEIASHIFTRVGTSGDPTLPSIEYLCGTSFPRLSDFWSGGLGAPAPSVGGKETYWGAILAVLQSSADSLSRVFAGVVLGLVVGVIIGLLTSASRRARALVAPSMHVLRMVPFLALAPLFEVWFGKTDRGAIAFISYGVGVVAFTGAIGAVSTLPAVYIDRSATNGATRWMTYRRVVLPGIVPAMRATLLVALGLAWTLDVAAEFLGTQSGLGVMMEYSLRFSYTGRVLVVAFIYLLYAAISYYLVEYLTGLLVRWQPRHQSVLAVVSVSHGPTPILLPEGGGY